MCLPCDLRGQPVVSVQTSSCHDVALRARTLRVQPEPAAKTYTPASQEPSVKTGNVCVYGSEPGATGRQADRWNCTELHKTTQDVSQQRVHQGWSALQYMKVEMKACKHSPISEGRNEAVLRC